MLWPIFLQKATFLFLFLLPKNTVRNVAFLHFNKLPEKPGKKIKTEKKPKMVICYQPEFKNILYRLSAFQKGLT